MGHLSQVEGLIQEGLTPAQATAAADTSPAILCIACAGSGKSQTLAYRIARLMSEQVPPSAIVVITFTVKAADSIKRRVASVLAKSGMSPSLIGEMYIGTIHGFCQNVLGDVDALYRQFDVLDGNRFTLFLMSRYPQLKAAPLRARFNNRYFETLKELQSAWNVYRDEGLSLDQINALDPQVGEALTAIGQKLTADQFLDFSSMIRLLVDRLKSDERVRARLKSIQHLLVDEYQDVSGSQEELIAGIHSLGSSLFVVGDDDQSVYGFRGAHVSNILEFAQRYAGVSQHALEINFRSTRAIVEMSNSFIAAQLGPQRLHKVPKHHADLAPNHVCVHHFVTRADEADWIADRIRRLLGTSYKHHDGSVRGLTPADFAILMQSTRSAEQSGEPRHQAFTVAMSARNIPFTLNAGGSVFDQPAVAALRQAFLALAEGPIDRPSADALINGQIRPAYSFVDSPKVYKVLGEWGRRIHKPQGTSRERLFPQALLMELLDAFNIAHSNFPEGVMRDIGLFSRMMQDIESVYLSVDSESRFKSIGYFLDNVAEGGYNVSTEDGMARPDAVTVSTVHQVKGLEFPVVFVADVVPSRFPRKRSNYKGLIPPSLIAPAIARGAYNNSPEAEARLFYTAITRAERYLHVTGAASLPGGKSTHKQSVFAAALQHPDVIIAPATEPAGLSQSPPRQKIDESLLPTSFSEIKYYLRCPMDYRFRKGYGFSPPVPELFGYGRVVHVAIEKLHEIYTESAPTPEQAAAVASETFHLKHVAPSRDPETRPGAYERAKKKSQGIVEDYVKTYADDFAHQRQVETRFEIPAKGCIITGSIDLLLKYDGKGDVVECHVVDFKTMEGGENPTENEELDWRELSLQVQLYAKAAREVLNENAATGSIHLLKDNQRVQVPIDPSSVQSAIENVEWAVQGIVARDYPMRPEATKCAACDFDRLCKKTPQAFRENAGKPPPIITPTGPMDAAAL
jgi:DNA helicase-2/ATP-dependent DNA helicase PcrA